MLFLWKKYVVAEGNRRICACKLLVNRQLIPYEYRNKFPFIKNNIENIQNLSVVLYDNPQLIQSYLCDRHIKGTKKWSTIEKNNYYVKLFKEHKNLDDVKRITGVSEKVIRDTVIQYNFFMEVFNIVKNKHKDIQIEDASILPLGDRFRITLVDHEIGLALSVDENTLLYKVDDNSRELYEKILFLVGEAFLIRPYEGEDDSSKRIVSREVTNPDDRKKLISEDKKIPGLLKLINQFREKHGITSGKSEVIIPPVIDGFGDNKKYYPPYKPRKRKENYLLFYDFEAEKFHFNGIYGKKNKFILCELSRLDVYNHPLTCALLYRTLIESVTKDTLIKMKLNPIENSLPSSVKYLLNNIEISELNDSLKDAIRAYIKEDKDGNLHKNSIISILNSYIHDETVVDENLLLSSWNTMKRYIKACLDYEHKK